MKINHLRLEASSGHIVNIWLDPQDRLFVSVERNIPITVVLRDAGLPGIIGPDITVDVNKVAEAIVGKAKAQAFA